MKNDNDYDRHFGGEFAIVGESILGEIIHNKKRGVIMLHVTKRIDSPGKAYGNIKYIHGTLNTGTKVTLCNNKCCKNHTYNMSIQELIFASEYMLWGTEITESKKYNKLTFTLDNALLWSELTQVDTSKYNKIKIHKNTPELKFNWFDSKITFSTQIKNDFNSLPRKEKCCISEKLKITIESTEKQNIPFFIHIRDSIISLISFAVKDNVNIDNQYLIDFDDYIEIPNCPGYKEYNKIELVCKRPLYQTNNISLYEYNFFLNNLSDKDDIADKLIKLEPIFHLYESLFKYHDMPSEMVFLNIVQALETFHSRFFYNDDKDKFVQSVEERYSTYGMYDRIKQLLLSPTQIDKNCRYIILYSRINDLLIDNEFIFIDFWGYERNFAQEIADTRHYYTHYGKEKEGKALKGQALSDAIYILRLLLEYSVCLVLGIDNKEKIQSALLRFSDYKQIEEIQN